MDEKQRLESDNAAVGKAVPGNPLGLGLVLVGAIALAISMFLPFDQPPRGLPIVIQNNSLFHNFGWSLLWIPLSLAVLGYQATRGKSTSRWLLIVSCAILAIGIVLVADYKRLRTIYPVGSDGTLDTSHPLMVTSLGVAVYVAGAGVAVAFIGALALFQSAGKQATNFEPTRQRRNGVRETRAPSVPDRDPQPEQGALEVESSAVEVSSHAGEARSRAIRSRLQSTWPLIAAIVVVVATVAGYLLGRPSPTPQFSTTPQAPLNLTPAQAALEKLLLKSDQINTAMGVTGLTVGGTANAMVNLASNVSDKACQAIAGPAEAEVYEGSGWSTVLGQELREPGMTYRHGVDQFVVSFPSAQDAGAFFTASAQRWLACANRQYTVDMMGQVLAHTVGPVSDADGTLSVTHTQPHGDAIYTCQRALTVANNIVVDVAACGLNQVESQSDAAVSIAHQIAAKVGNTKPAPESASAPTAAPPGAESVLDGLLLNSDQINAAMGTTGMTVTNTWRTTFDDTANVAPADCLPVYGPAETKVYSASGWTAVLTQILEEVPSQDRNHRVEQSVVLFPSADAAAAFVRASSQSWMACAHRIFTTTFSGDTGSWTSGPVSTADGILDVTKTQANTNGWSCQRALTARNNVVADIGACSYHATDQGVSIARQVAAKVPPA